MPGRAIFKEAISSAPVQRFEWPAGSQVLHAEIKDGQPCIWFVCTPTEVRRPRTFLLLPTGGPFGKKGGWSHRLGKHSHIATFLSEDRALVGHLFEVGSISADEERQIEEDLGSVGKALRGRWAWT